MDQKRSRAKEAVVKDQCESRKSQSLGSRLDPLCRAISTIHLQCLGVRDPEKDSGRFVGKPSVGKPSVIQELITDKDIRPQNNANAERGPQWTDRGGI